MLQPMLGFWSWLIGLPASRASTAARRSAPGDRLAVARTAVVHLSAIDQLALLVEEEEVGRAGGPVGLGHLLRLVVQIGEGVAGGTTSSPIFSGLSSGYAVTSLELIPTTATPLAW